MTKHIPRSPSPVAKRVGELERLGPNGCDVLVLGLDAPGFETLPKERKILAYYLYRAAVAGNHIMTMQNHRYGLEVTKLFETLYQHSSGLEPDVLAGIHDYLKYLWIHHGQYHHATHTKFVPNSLDMGGLLKATAVAIANGASVETRPGETLEAKLKRLERTIFDADFEPLQSNQSPGEDILKSSAVNYWDRGITQADLDRLPDGWKNRLNVRFRRGSDGIVPQVYRIGGLYDAELRNVSHFLERALPWAESEEQRRSIESLLSFYRSGEETHFREHSIHWLKADTTIDYLNGFIEQYIDPRGVIGSFEANVSYAADATIISKIAENALYFEQRMPWPDRYKRSVVERPVSKVVDLVVATGDAGPVSPAAYNLPNYNDIRRDHGSKSVILLNIENSTSQALFETIVKEFYLPEYRYNVFRHALTIVRPLEVYLHEVIGHGSGQPDPDLDVDPRAKLGRVYSALEEARSDLVALYHMSDPKMVEIGAIPAEQHAAVVETAYITYTQGWLMRMDRVDGYEVREAHNKGHHLILTYLLEGGGDPNRDFGVEIITRNGDYYIRLRDPSRMRVGLGELLRHLQIVKSTGDGRSAAEIFDRFGTIIPAEWKRNIAARHGKLNIPRLKAFVFPRLSPRTDGDGRIVDVDIHCDEDLTTQQLRFSRLQSERDSLSA